MSREMVMKIFEKLPEHFETRDFFINFYYRKVREYVEDLLDIYLIYFSRV